MSTTTTLPVPTGLRPTLQMLFGRRGPASDPDQVHAAAARGTATAASQLPHLAQIQRSFGRHDVSGVQAHVGTEAAASARDMGAAAYATGNDVVLGTGTDLHTEAHEAAHVVQQRSGVQLKGGVGEVGDVYERHADEVADRVVRGESAEELLDRHAGAHVQATALATVANAAPGIQRKVTVGGAPVGFEEAKRQIEEVRGDVLTTSETAALTDMCADASPELNLTTPKDLARALKKEMASRYGVNSEEIDAIDHYQGGGYKPLNKTLRDEDPLTRTDQKNVITPLLSGMSKLPKTTGQNVKRTLSFETKAKFLEFVAQIDSVGKEMTTSQFDSMTRASKEVSLPDNHAYVIMLVVAATGHHGAEISSVLSVIEKSESETLFPPGTRYQVTRPPEKPTRDHDSGNPFTTTAELVELEALDDSKQTILSFAEYKKEKTKRLFGGGAPAKQTGTPSATLPREV